MDINGIMKNKITKKSTVRDIMQILGTDLLRQGFNNSIHVAVTLGSIKENEKVIITDMRFENEFEAVKKRGGLCITIQRGEIPKQEHYSERALDGDRDWDYIINNNGSLEDLVEKVREILREAL